MNSERGRLLDDGLRQLPAIEFPLGGRNGETFATDEAAVWKRVLNYRLAQQVKPRLILETHPGLGISTVLYRQAYPKAQFIDLSQVQSDFHRPIELIDIDPFGSPWDMIDRVLPFLNARTVVQISNGEAHAVRRNLRRGQKYPTRYVGRQLPQWVIKEYLPRIERIVGLQVRFFYAFPTTVRVIMSRRTLPTHLWNGCPQWMWWLAKYAPKSPLQIRNVYRCKNGK